ARKKDPRSRYDLGRLRGEQGLLALSRNNLTEADAALTESMNLMKDQALTDPRATLDVLRTKGRLAVLNVARKPSVADNYFKDAVEGAEFLQKKYRNDPEIVRVLGESYANWATTLLNRGKSQDADSISSRAVDRFTDLVAQEKLMPEYRMQLALAQRGRA